MQVITRQTYVAYVFYVVKKKLRGLMLHILQLARSMLVPE